MERASYDRPATTAKGSLPGFRMSAAGGVRAATVQRQGPRRACSVGRVLRRFYEQGETSLSATPVAPPARGLRRLSGSHRRCRPGPDRQRYHAVYYPISRRANRG